MFLEEKRSELVGVMVKETRHNRECLQQDRDDLKVAQKEKCAGWKTASADC